MKKMFHGIGEWIEKIGKSNFIFVLFIFIMITITGLYTTFSLSTFHEGTVSIDGVRTMKFVLGESDETHTVSIAENSTKNVAITISNKEKTDLSYGIFYVSSDDLADVEIGYRHSTLHLPNGVIPTGEDYIVTIRIVNNSSSMKMISFGLMYGFENGGDFVLNDQQHFLKQEKSFPLNEVRKGSYVKYSGNNGCVDEQCLGKNVNAVGNDKGFCGDDKTSFLDDGWKVAYVREGSTYLISSSAVECLEQGNDTNEEFLKKLNDKAGLYCNIDFSYHGECDSNSVWAMNIEDYYRILGNHLDDEFCFQNDKEKSCGYKNDMIDIGSYYWVSSVLKSHIIYYQPSLFYSVGNELAKGVRPVIRLADSIVVYQGTGTKDDPYLIKNNILADYEYRVVYNGNGATSGDVKDSVYHTNVNYKLNKNQFTLSYQLKMSDVALFDDSYCDDNDVCHTSSIPDVISKEAKFLGWSILADDIEPMYTDEETVTNLSLSSEEVVVNLFAVWDYGIYLLPNIQKRDGYKILGWFTEKDGGEKIGEPGDEYQGSKDVHLYARWEKIDD